MPEPCLSPDAESQQSSTYENSKARGIYILYQLYRVGQKACRGGRVPVMGVTAPIKSDECFKNMWLPKCLVSMVVLRRAVLTSSVDTIKSVIVDVFVKNEHAC